MEESGNNDKTEKKAIFPVFLEILKVWYLIKALKTHCITLNYINYQ